MSIAMAELYDVVWLDEHHQFTVSEFMKLTELSAGDLQHLVDCEALRPVSGIEPAAETAPSDTRFSGECLSLARAASRLHHDFELDTNGLALTLQLLNRIHELETELSHLRALGLHSPR